MSIDVFVGPTLSRERIQQVLPAASVFNPVAFGDVYRSTNRRVRAILIVDGYFERVPAVWHKEILWAMSEGVHVLGASSMGALRAAELTDYGMVGIGQIFEAYRAGDLEDDDEVTIVHASAEHGFRPLSEAMVNIRATVAAAVKEGVVSNVTADLFVSVGKDLFYADRSYEALALTALKRGACSHEVRALRTWLPQGRVDQKARDAEHLLHHVSDWMRTDPPPLEVSYRFEPTDAWLHASRMVGAQRSSPGPAGLSGNGWLEEELKLAGVYPTVRDSAALRSLAVEEARGSGFRPDPTAVGHAAGTLRRKLGLADSEAFREWCEREGLEQRDLVRLVDDEACLLWNGPRLDAAADAGLVDSLRACGKYAMFMRRAEHKARLLSELGGRTPSMSDLGTNEAELWQWYFESRGHGDVPHDLQQFALNAGFADEDEMRSAILRDLYCSRGRGQYPRPDADAAGR